MGLFFYTKKGSIISTVDLPTTEIIEPKNAPITPQKAPQKSIKSPKVNSGLKVIIKNTIISIKIFKVMISHSSFY